ncbi:MAG: hypothetical protein M1828_001873 [Chrysothrix sp. TS-e1954]|nr:MAG: hypothetical protein M1828_001873 [Chrysothrix sp. TS-e1954]
MSPALAGKPIPVFDPWIICFGSPPPVQAGWPASRPRTLYKDQLALCSEEHGAQYTAGCICHHEGGTPLCSLTNGADRDLWNARLIPAWTGGYMTFDGWCANMCICASEESATRYYNENPKQLATSNAAPDPNPPPAGSNQRTGGVGFPNTFANPFSNINDTNGSWQNLNADARCGGACTVGSQCNSGISSGLDAGPDECLCQVQSSTYEPSSGALLYTAKCVIEFPNKRHEARPCPCNSTYVSHGCCGSRDGLIHEPVELKLGELVDDPESL